MRTIHLTCFDAFGALRENPTRPLVEALVAPPGWRASKTVLPTSYRRVGPAVGRIFDQDPDALVMLGYASAADRLRIEHVARNRDTSPVPDNDGSCGRPVIRHGGPPAHASTVDLAPLMSALYARSVPFSYSVDAGGFVCNHSYYLALERAWATRPTIPCVFIHIPLPRTSALRSQLLAGADAVLRYAAQTAPSASQHQLPRY